MATLTGSSVVVSSATPDGFVVGQVPTTQVGFIKESDQTAIFVFSKAPYKIYFKNPAGNWVRHADVQSIPVNNTGLTYPWGDYSAVCFAVSDIKQVIHVHIKRGTVLYDTTPEDSTDNNFTLLSGDQEINVQTGNYDLPPDDGTDGQILKTDGAGTVTWGDTLAPGAKFLSKVILVNDQEISQELRGEHNAVPDACRWTKMNFGSEAGPTPGWSTAANQKWYIIPEDGWYEFSSTLQWNFRNMPDETWFDAMIASSHSDGASSPESHRKLEKEVWKPYQILINRVHVYPLASTRFLQQPVHSAVELGYPDNFGGLIHNQKATNITATSYCVAGEKISVWVRCGHAHNIPALGPYLIMGNTNEFGGLVDDYRGVESNLIIKKL